MTSQEIQILADRWAEPTGVPFLEEIHAQIALEGLEPTRYYRFLYHLSKAMQPQVIVELGTYAGHSSAHLALGCPAARVYTVDPTPVQVELDKVLKMCPNLKWIAERSEHVGREFKRTIDLLFMDSSHSAEQCRLEYQLFRPKMTPGGIIVVDDLWYGTVSEFWREVPEEKLVIDVVHPNSGFGIILLK